VAANGGPVKIYTPNTENASSFSHLDGEAIGQDRSLSPVVLGILADLGYTIAA
jgi:hypothetical protein